MLYSIALMTKCHFLLIFMRWGIFCSCLFCFRVGRVFFGGFCCCILSLSLSSFWLFLILTTMRGEEGEALIMKKKKVFQRKNVHLHSGIPVYSFNSALVTSPNISSCSSIPYTLQNNLHTDFEKRPFLPSWTYWCEHQSCWTVIPFCLVIVESWVSPPCVGLWLLVAVEWLPRKQINGHTHQHTTPQEFKSSRDWQHYVGDTLWKADVHV